MRTAGQSSAGLLSRRQLLTGTACAALAFDGLAPRAWSDEATLDALSSRPEFAFFVIGDTHYLADQANPTKIDDASAKICRALVETLNRLPGESIPASAGGGTIASPFAVIHTGDIIDTGDKKNDVSTAMQETEWNHFVADYGLSGEEGRLKYPVFEVYGNHDSPHGEGSTLERLRERNQQRRGLRRLSENHLHYSWDVGRVHFVNLGLIVGTDLSITRKRRYAALDSLAFLVKDLRESVGNSNRPVIITHHVDIARYAIDFDPQAPPNNHEWDPCDVAAFYRAIEPFNIAAIFYGHTHARNIFRWNGKSVTGETGIPVFNADNASHFGGDAQAFFYVEVRENQIAVREYETTDRWQTGRFTPQVWTAPIT